jgi:GxxExxY protein
VSDGFQPIHIATSRREEEGRDPRTSPILGAALEVHRHLGPGLLESAYEECLCHELRLRGLSFQRQVDLPVEYKGLKLECGYKIDLVVQDEVILELKAVEKLMPIHQAQLLTYLKLAHKTVGLLIQLQCPALDTGHHPTSSVTHFTTETQSHRERKNT